MHIEAGLYQRIREILPTACVDVVITSGDQFLLCRRAEKPALGQWWFPGGRVLFGESLRDACVRKSLEEVGLAVEPGETISIEETVFDDPKVHTINAVIRARLVGSSQEVELDGTQSDHRWMARIPADIHPCVARPLARLGFVTNSCPDRSLGSPTLDPRLRPRPAN